MCSRAFVCLLCTRWSLAFLSSSWSQELAAAYDCGTPWTFLFKKKNFTPELTIYYINSDSCGTYKMSNDWPWDSIMNILFVPISSIFNPRRYRLDSALWCFLLFGTFCSPVFLSLVNSHKQGLNKNMGKKPTIECRAIGLCFLWTVLFLLRLVLSSLIFLRGRRILAENMSCEDTPSCSISWLKRVRLLYNWAATWQNQQSGCVPSEDSDQPGHPPSLIRVFAVRLKKAWVLSYPLSAQQRLWSDWADAQADLSLRWAHSHFVCFVMLRLILSS